MCIRDRTQVFEYMPARGQERGRQWMIVSSKRALHRGCCIKVHVDSLCLDDNWMNSWKCVIGVCGEMLTQQANDNWMWQADNYVFVLGEGKKWRCGNYEKYGVPVRQGDVVTIILSPADILVFHINGQSQGYAFEKLNENYHLFLGLSVPGRLEILNTD
eukprot:TRINITY_DN9977_c0_g1_i1.p1 TRINITY_DN9977_c0_g1~~TRINITY_DN9977_c0_g1_i1.p1  ORF type:complete len:178 (-),score=32.61 TRINITY_DN9977_c0_g1_i1:155-631(-)